MTMDLATSILAATQGSAATGSLDLVGVIRAAFALLHYFDGEIRRSSSKKFRITTTLSRFPPSSV